MKLDYLHMLLLLVPVIFLYRLLVYKIYDRLEKAYLTIIYWGLYFYGGVGASSYEVEWIYSVYFLIFISVFVFFYRLKYVFPHAVKNAIGRFYNARGATIFDKPASASAFIYIYLLICLTSLIYPSFKLLNLVHPPAPDLITALLGTIETPSNINIVSKLFFYLTLLLYPLYLLCLNNFATKPLKLIIFLFIPLYIDYCATAYVGRGLILIDLAVWLLTVYKYNKKIRVPLITGFCILTPLLLVIAYSYSIARAGGEYNVTLSDNAIETLFYQEVNFAEGFKDVVNSGQHINLPGFMVWLVTLPIPKFLIGGVNVPIITFELSEIVIGMNRHDEGFWVKLTGYVTESYYIFGKYFFWVEALMVAWLAKAIFYFLRNIKGNAVLVYYVALQFGFMFSRAGLASVMPTFLNGFLALYVYFGLKVYLSKQKFA